MHNRGRQCQNWPVDQQHIIDLLNRIPANQGGAHGTLSGRIISGISSDALYGAILAFEEKHFPGRRSGFVDPNGAVLRRMEALVSSQSSAPSAPSPQVSPKPPSPLQILRRNLLDDAEASRIDPFFPMFKSQIQPLITMAHRHISNLIEMGRTELPWRVELFGRAYVLSRDLFISNLDFSASHLVFGRDSELITVSVHDETRSPLPSLPEMRFGAPIAANSDVWTERLSALLLFKNGLVIRMEPYRRASISLLERRGPDGLPLRSDEYFDFVSPWAAA